MERYIMSLVEREVANWPDVLGIRIDRGHRHNRLYIDTAKGSRFVTFAKTASDHRVAKNVVRDVRKELRSLGAEKD